MKEISLRVVYSQDLEALIEALIEEFFVCGAPVFECRLIVVPHLGMKDFLVDVLSSRLQIASGVQILPLHQAVMEIVDRLDLEDLKKIPSLLELSLAIQEHLLMLDPDLITDPALKLYFQGQTLSPQKITGLSTELAKLFTRYGLFGEGFLSSWLEMNGWQQEIWKSVFKKSTYPLEFFSKIKQPSFQGKIALFGFSYIAPVHLRFFNAVQASCYFFSPSALFWEDLVSDHERINLDRLAKRQGVSSSTREQLCGYMTQGHPLLANWGKMGKQMAAVLQGSLLDEEDRYVIPSSNRLLSSVQRSILNLDETETLSSDDSIQVHSATSRLREVEILRDVIESLLQKEPILPDEILVLAPDLSLYAPFVRQVFASSPFPFVMETKESLSERTQGFLTLLNLSKHRYSLSAVTDLLNCGAFREKAGFSLQEVDQLASWFKKARILFDLSGHPQSWKEGLDRLLYGLVQIPEGDSQLGSWPISCIPHSEIDTFNRFLALFSQIQQDLFQLQFTLSLSNWLDLLLQIHERYFSGEEKSDVFFSELTSLRKSYKSLEVKEGIANPSKIWVFESVYLLLQNLAQKSQERSSSFSKGKILFSSLDKAPLKPAKVIWCMGLDEESFPKVEIGTSLSAKEWKKVDCPHQIDQDRFVFLEMLMKAKQYLFFSYERIDARDCKEKGVCLLVEELSCYFKSRGIQEGLQITRHPGFAFDETYFSKDSAVKRWRQSDYLAAKAYYSPPKKQKSFFIEGITKSQFSEKMTESQEVISLVIPSLKKCARNPLQLYFNQTLQLFLKDEENEEEEEFVLSFLKKSLYRKEGCQKPLSYLTARIRAEGKLPLGGFQGAALYELEEEMQPLLRYLQQFQVKQEEISSVHFVDCLERERRPNREPLLRVGDFTIQGELEGVTPQGLLFHGTSDLQDLIKIWPLYLIYLHLYPQNPYLLLTKEGIKFSLPVSNPQLALESYLNFYQESLMRPCPLLPSNVKHFLENNRSAFAASLEKETEDPYWNYVKRRDSLSQLEASFPFWQMKIASLFEGIS